MVQKTSSCLSNITASSKFPQYIAALSICLGAVASGSVLGWTSTITEKLKNQDLNNIPIDDDSLGWIGSLATLGGMCICLPIGFICDYFGRKWGCLLTVIPFSAGWLLIIFSTDIGMIYAGRFLNGIAGGAFCVAAPLYTTEISENSIRGELGSYFQLLQTIGILIAYVAGAYMDPQPFSFLCGALPLLFAVVFFFQPETPLYLLKKNKEEKAMKSLRKLRGANYDCDAEMLVMKEIIEKNAEHKNTSFFNSLNSVAAKKASIYCLIIMSIQQLSGINVVIFYTNDIFEASGSSLNSSTASIIIGILQVVATFVSSRTVDKFGRKILLISSISLMGLSEFVLGLFFSFKDRDILSKDAIDSIGFLPILSMSVFIVMFSMGVGPIPWMITAELLPEDIKSTMCSIAAVVNWLLAFIVTKFYVNLKNAIGGDVTFYIFAAICFVSAAFFIIFIPETKGKSVNEVQDMLSNVKRPTNKTNNI